MTTETKTKIVDTPAHLVEELPPKPATPVDPRLACWKGPPLTEAELQIIRDNFGWYE